MKLQNKVAIVTGGAAGIGKSIASAYAKEGATVVIADFDEQRLNETVHELQDSGATSLGIVVDVSNDEHIDEMIRVTVETYGTVDILVNNAGIGDNMQAAANVENETFQRVMDINVGGVMRGMRAILPQFERQGHGVIVNMASIGGVTGGRAGLTYTAAKHAVVGMTKNVASHYGAVGVRANAIAPGFIETEFSAKMDAVDPFGMQQAIRATNLNVRPGSPDEVANVALFLASDDASYVSGQVIVADLGWSAY